MEKEIETIINESIDKWIHEVGIRFGIKINTLNDTKKVKKTPIKTIKQIRKSKIKPIFEFINKKVETLECETTTNNNLVYNNKFIINPKTNIVIGKIINNNHDHLEKLNEEDMYECKQLLLEYS